MASKTRPCEICKKPIENERLTTYPESRLCVEHGKKILEHGGEFIMTTSQERTSKEGSLKINYGGVTASMKRNHKAIEKLKDEFDEEKWRENNLTM